MIELEEGQKYTDAYGAKYEVLKLYVRDDIGRVCYFKIDDLDNKNTIDVCIPQFQQIKGLKLTHEADGKEVKEPNDYRPGDVWRAKDTGSSFFICENGRYCGKNFNNIVDMAETALMDCPEDFELVFREFPRLKGRH